VESSFLIEDLDGEMVKESWDWDIPEVHPSEKGPLATSIYFQDKLNV
jgi:hypothetical protein